MRLIDENLRFLIIEVRKQLVRTRKYLEHPSERVLESVLARDDYIDNLRNIIQRKCFSIAADGTTDTDVVHLKAIDIIAVNLERIADFCENITDQSQYLQDEGLLDPAEFGPFFDEIIAGVDLVEGAAFDHDLPSALQICRHEDNTDRLYEAVFNRVVDELSSGERAREQLTLVFIYRYLERMGDALLNIGEAIISARMGERIKINQFWALEDSLEDVSAGTSMSDVVIEPMGETRSGCRIDRIRRPGDSGRALIFKEGREPKMREEKAGIEKWATLFPELAPRIFSYHTQNDHASMLYEFLSGRTVEDLVLRGTDDELAEGVEALCSTVGQVWRKTRRNESVSARFTDQLEQRLGDVHAVHPDFRERGAKVAGASFSSIEELLRRAKELEEALPPAFAVMIHGDFNVDNIIYDPNKKQIHFVDLHRSRHMDYVQDVSVFVVSNLRLQVFDPPVRARIERTVRTFLDFAHDFAREARDTTFSTRLALGLARSFVTSTRFVLDEDFARSLLMRATYLLERVTGEDSARVGVFEIPEELLIG